jgi:hypothetical protein
MTLKNTILISAVTYFVLNALVWVLGWMVWPIAIFILWKPSARLFFFLEEKLSLGSTKEEAKRKLEKSGPFLFFNFAESYYDKIAEKYFPSIRNPFIWPEKELDKQENKD